jgi:imidazolonepropionase-like amidohydrolase
MVFSINPDLDTAACVDLDSPMVKKALADGVTTVNSMPGSGTNHAGFTVIFKLFAKGAREAIVRDPGCLKVAQAFNPERDTGDMGATRMGMAYMLRKLLLEGKEYAGAWKDYREGKRKEPPALRRDLERVRLVFEGKIPVINHTYSGWGVAEAIRLFHDEFGLTIIPTHVAYGGYQVGEYAAARATKVHVDVGPHLIDSMRIGDGRMHGIASEFWQRGVRNLSLNTDSFTFFYSQLSPEQHLFFQASMAAHLGLPENAALRAITIEPANALGIADRVGSLKTGKDADIVLKHGELLDVASPVDVVIVDGVVAFMRHECGVTIKAPAPAAPPPAPPAPAPQRAEPPASADGKEVRL